MKSYLSNGFKYCSGIYMIFNIINQKFYIGSAKNLDKRRSQHLAAFKGNKHTSLFQRAWNKYGGESFCFFMLELCPLDKLQEREQYYLNLLKPYKREIGYNINEIAYSSLGKKVSAETRAKLSARKIPEDFKKRIQDNYIVRYGKDFKVLSPDGIVHKGIGSNKFAREHGLNVGNFNKMLRGEACSCQGWKSLSEKQYKPSRHKHWPEIFNITAPDGSKHTLTQEEFILFCKEYNLNQQKMLQSYRQTYGRKTHKGFYKTQ